MSNCCRQTCRLWSSRDLLGNSLTGNSGDFLATNLLLLIVAQPNERQGVPLLSHTRCLDSFHWSKWDRAFDLREEEYPSPNPNIRRRATNRVPQVHTDGGTR